MFSFCVVYLLDASDNHCFSSFKATSVLKTSNDIVIITNYQGFRLYITTAHWTYQFSAYFGRRGKNYSLLLLGCP